jgi:HSP20 family protein
MAIIKARGNFLPELPSLFDDFLSKDLFNWNNKNILMENSIPAVNIKETADSFDLEVAAPGLDKKDFKINLENNILTISAEKENQSEEKGKDGNYTRKEFSYTRFTRSFNLPDQMVHGDKIEAKYNDGILHILVPKKEEAKVKPSRQIAIN